MPAFDLYRELEVDPQATTETIEAAWRSLVKRFHPDLQPGRRIALEKTRRLNVAHDWLVDPPRRARYDAWRASSGRTGTGEGSRRWSRSRTVPAALPLRLAGIGVRPAAERSPLILRSAGYLACCVAAIAAAYIGAAIVILFLAFANVTAIASLILGPDGTGSLLQLLGNLVYCVLVGYLMAASFRSLIEPSADEVALIAVGTLGALALTFGLPAFAATYLPGLLGWFVTDGAGLPAVVAIGCQDGLLGGMAVFIVGLLASRGGRSA